MIARLSPILIVIRLVTGLIMMAYCLGHMLNHAVGIISIEAMDAVREQFIGFWRAPGVYWVTPISIVLHLVAAVALLMSKRTLKVMDRMAKFQIALGMLLPLLLCVHIGYSRGTFDQTGRDLYYSNFFYEMYKQGGLAGLVIYVTLLTSLVWGHGCLGMHRWLKVKSWYNKYWNFWYLMAILPPCLSMFGSLTAYRETVIRVEDPNWVAELDDRHQWKGWTNAEGQPFEQADIDAIIGPIIVQLLGAFVFTVVTGVIIRLIWLQLEKKKATIEVRFGTGEQIKVAPGTSLLEASQFAGLSQASVCGGHGRCSTCRVRILAGNEDLPAPEGDEAKVLSRISAPPNVRLACQVRPSQSVTVHPILRQATGADGFARPSFADGEEIDVTLLFADLRGFTKMSDKRLPYDVVFILNQYFELMGEAIESTDGYLDKFIGDGIMAIFGIRSGADIGAKQAIGAAIKMGQRLSELNARLEGELDEPLRMGIGLHRGSAIVGNMGYGDAMSVTAIGSTVNTAARLEGTAKTLNVQLVISKEVTDAAGVDLPDHELHSVEVRGRQDPLDVYAIEDASQLKPVRRQKKEMAAG